MSDKTTDAVRQAVREELERERENATRPHFAATQERMSRGYAENDAAREAEKDKQR